MRPHIRNSLFFSMSSIVNNSFAKIAASIVAVSLVVGFAFAFTAYRAEAATLTDAQISSIISLLQSFGADSSTIANVSASLHGTAVTSSSSSMTTTTTGSSSCSFTRDLTVGSKGADVTCLQNALIAAGDMTGTATGYFGAITKAAVMKWQTSASVTPAAGYFGAKSRAAFGSSSSSTTTTTTTGGTTTTTTGTGLTVAAGSQPGNSLAPQGTSRVPFTRFTLTAGNDGDVSVNGITVQRTGLGSDAAFSGVILVDEATGMQLGNSQTFNSNHQTTIGGTFVVPRGTTRSYLVAGNMAADESGHSGEAPSVSVVAVNTAATVAGSLPIVGASQTINSTLTTGSVTVATSNSFASNSNQSPNIGDTGRKTTGLRLTAGSAEDLTLKWVRFNQTGSVSSTDLANVAVNIAGTAYPLTVSSDGKYYAASLGSGVVITKGNQVDMYVSYDVVGGNSSGRSVIFDVDKNTDIFAVGNTYGYGVSPAAGVSAVPTTRGTITITSGTPYVYATQDSIVGASVTTIAKANEVPAQNIAVNLQNQPLGGFVVDLKGENMTVQSLAVTVATSSGSGTGTLTSVSLVNENGAVVAGPYDANAAGTTITFSSSITFPTGRHVYTIKGKVNSSIGNGTVYTLSTTPSGWGSPKGDVSGNAISLASNGVFSMNAMTVKTGAVVIGRATSPASQNLVSGGTGTLMANFQFDASQSGEDVRFATAKVKLLTGALAGDESKLTSCQLFDGSTALNTGSNVLNPSTATATSTVDFYTGSITLDNPVTVAKGTVKTLGMRCNISSTADNNSTFSWDVQDATNWTFTGATSGTTITNATDALDSAVTVTVGTGSATVALGADTPGYAIASSGSTGVTDGTFKFRATNESVNLTKLGLQIAAGSIASSSASDLVKVSIFNGTTQVGTAYFTGNATVATSTFTSPVLLTKDADTVLTVKVDLASINSSAAVPFSGHLVKVDFLNAEGTGASSGTTIYPSGSTAVSGVRVMKSVPTFSKDALSSTGAADGELLHFKVTADAAGPISIAQFQVTIATSTANTAVSNVNIYGYTDSSYSTPISGVTGSGQLDNVNQCVAGVDGKCASNSTKIVVPVMTAAGVQTSVQVPAGQTRYFAVRGNVTTVTGSSIVTTLIGDSAYPLFATTEPVASSSGFMAAEASSTVFGASYVNGFFVWSPNSTTTSSVNDVDWTNGFGVAGLPSSGITQSRSN